ncbi:uncharacterized protein B0H18DRAFT_1130547 [Fomitopsis serialis]|uniref:uncharacterized protein n=1 Tax=Fomitopsis serialis TaxID=139415 RepID=UPI002007A684|nr:uncharacterized protein B0H18DRAFT_1130547 [Neoantrodia serialis]KAH9910185.1 hypothetical protein B0H18DRAFT_1130547 [Neoantrodia serialis]
MSYESLRSFTTAKFFKVGVSQEMTQKVTAGHDASWPPTLRADPAHRYVTLSRDFPALAATPRQLQGPHYRRLVQLGDSRHLSDKYSSSVSPTNLNHTWNFSDLAPPSSPPTSVDDEDYVEAVQRWPFARRIFGNLLEDRDFPALPDVLIETPNFQPEDWDLLRSKLRDKPEILRHFWFRYDRKMATVVAGSASGLHQDVVLGCASTVVEDIIKPVVDQVRVPGTLVTQNGARLLVREDHIEVPDCMVGLFNQAKKNKLCINLNSDCVLIESARTQSAPHVLAKVTDNMTASDTSESVAEHTYVRQMASVAGSEGEETEDGMQTQTDDEDGTQMQTDDDDGTQTQTEDGDDDGTQTPAGPETEHAGEEPSSPLTPLPDVSSPLSPLSDASFPSPPPLPPPVAPLPPQRGQKISSVVFVVVSTQEKAVKKAPPGVDINKQDWVELPCPDDDCITGGIAYGGRIYVGEIRAYMWVLQGAEDHTYLAKHWKDDLEEWVRSGKALLLRRRYATDEQKQALRQWEARWRECMLSVRHKVLHNLIIAKSSQCTPVELVAFEEKIDKLPDLSLPPIKSPVGVVRALVGSGSWRLAEERYAKATNATTQYSFDGIVGSRKEAFKAGASLKRALDEGDIGRARRALKRRHLDTALVDKKSSLTDSDYLGSADGSSDPIPSDPLRDLSFNPDVDDGHYSQDSNYGESSQGSQQGSSQQGSSRGNDSSQDDDESSQDADDSSQDADESSQDENDAESLSQGESNSSQLDADSQASTGSE